MKSSKLLCYCLILIFVFSQFPAFGRTNDSARSGAVNRFLQPSEKAQKWAKKTLRALSSDEKIGQLISIGINAQFWNEDSDAFQEIKRQIVENKIGGVCLFGSPVYEAVHVTNRMQALANIPLLISSDFEAGVGMRFDDTVNFPWNMAVAATGDPEFARRQGAITAQEARALGVEQIFAPVVDVNNNAQNPVINVRSFGENPIEVARFANALIQGIQANNALATVKHFPGHGDTAVDSHRGLPIINLPRARFDAVEFVPFKSAIEAGVSSVMISHISVPQLDSEEVKPLKQSNKPTDTTAEQEIRTENATLPATLSNKVQTDILRRDLNFKGLIVTDAMSMSGLTLYFNQEEAGTKAFLAGADMLLKPSDPDAMIRGLREAVKSGRITNARLDESVLKILATKYELGLVSNKIASLDAVDKFVAAKAARDLAEEIATKAITLVRDGNKLLPLEKDKRIFVFGITNGADREFIANTFLRGLRQSGLNFESVILDDRATETEISEALTKARNAEIVLAPLYGRVRTGSKTSVGLPEKAGKGLQQLLSENQNVVGISFGNPYLLMEFPTLKTYLVAYGDMASLQRAAARGLLGQQSVTGRLPISLPGLYARGTGIQIEKK